MTASLTIIKSNEFIVMVSDSLVADLNDKPLRTQRKILQAGQFVFLPNNFVEYEATGYNLSRIAESIPAQPTLDSLASKFREAVPPHLTTALRNWRNRNPERFKLYFDTNQAMGITVAGIEDRQVRLIDMRFFMVDPEAYTLEIDSDSRSCPGPDIPSGFGEIFVGHDFVQKVFKSEYDTYMLGGIDRVAAYCEAYVQMTIIHGGSSAGPPITVLVITPDGFDWRSPKPDKSTRTRLK